MSLKLERVSGSDSIFRWFATNTRKLKPPSVSHLAPTVEGKIYDLINSLQTGQEDLPFCFSLAPYLPKVGSKSLPILQSWWRTPGTIWILSLMPLGTMLFFCTSDDACSTDLVGCNPKIFHQCHKEGSNVTSYLKHPVHPKSHKGLENLWCWFAALRRATKGKRRKPTRSDLGLMMSVVQDYHSGLNLSFGQTDIVPDGGPVCHSVLWFPLEVHLPISSCLGMWDTIFLISQVLLLPPRERRWTPHGQMKVFSTSENTFRVKNRLRSAVKRGISWPHLVENVLFSRCRFTEIICDVCFVFQVVLGERWGRVIYFNDIKSKNGQIKTLTEQILDFPRVAH